MTTTFYDEATVSLYDRLAPTYDALHRRWLRYAGGEAQASLEAAVRALMTQSSSLLDVGCGTGTFARALIAEGMPPGNITLLDPSQAMLDQAADLPVQRVNGRLSAIPFGDSTFDIVTCAWALETTSDLVSGIDELCRVVRPGGAICLAFCAAHKPTAAAGWLLQKSVQWRRTGRFLPHERVADCLRARGDFEVRVLPGHGPAAALLAKRVSRAEMGRTT